MPRALWFLVIGMAINVTGASFLWPLNTIYISGELGKSLTTAGLVLMANAGASVLGNLLGGVLFDKIGGYKSIMSGILITLTAVGGLMIWHGWPHYVFFMIFIGFGSGIVFPSMYAMAGSVWPEGGRKAFNAIYLATNIGVATGAAMGGFVASFSFNYIFIANFVMYVIFFLIALLTYKNIELQPNIQTSVLQERGQIQSKAAFTSLLILCAAYLLCWVGYVQWQSTIADYTQRINIPLELYSVLWTVNGLLIVAGQPLIKPIVKRFEHNLKIQMAIGTVIFMVSFAVTAYAGSFQGFLAAMIILTIGEMLIWPAVPTIASRLAPKGREGFYQGVVNSTATGGRMIGPLLGGIMVDLYGMTPLFFLLIGLLVISIGITFIYDLPLKKKEVEAAA
ncbi:MDR family MFS transporter [Jeotgalibacillus haloalkalitolerans]|uniref:MFS transporter n=1 Tax=Jeotgalibacillus haloalkalitolerans TaxID=3104292 RepID=A0ABU5KMP9_9BACL|nr:MFS transporter [Jeotgalibacillus sp. HH7-29]MDZ5712538.1 MFS transporter [Jeotgalibacillus sp. HH7-29]